jgi:hypothetical protein
MDSLVPLLHFKVKGLHQISEVTSLHCHYFNNEESKLIVLTYSLSPWFTLHAVRTQF